MGSRSRHHFLGVVRQEAFVHTDNAHPRLHHSFVRGIHQLLIIKPPHVLGWTAWIAHGVALPRRGLVKLMDTVDFLHPARLVGCHDRVAEHPRAAGFLVDGLACRDDLIVVEVPILNVIIRRARQHSHFGIAVEEHLFDEVWKFEKLVGSGLAEFWIKKTAGIGTEAEKALEARVAVIVANEVQLLVEHELLREPACPRGCPFRVGRLRGLHDEMRSEHLVHGHESGCHPGRRLQEFPAGHPLLADRKLCQLAQPAFEPALQLAARRRSELSVRDSVRWYWRSVAQPGRAGGFAQLIGSEEATHGSPPFRSYAATTAIAVISTIISGTANAAAVSNVLAGNSFP